MKNRNGFFVFVLILALALALSACGGGGGGGGAAPGPTDPNLGTPVTPTVMPSLSFIQNIASQNSGTYSSGLEVFPGQANIWTLDGDLAVVNDQFVYCPLLLVGGPTGTEFPNDQNYTDLTFYTPLMGATEGIKAAAVSDGVSIGLSPLAGGHSAFLNATADSRLQQVVSLPSGTLITIGWSDDVWLSGSLLFEGPTSTYHVVLRNQDGTVFQTLYPTLNNQFQTGPRPHSIDVGPFVSTKTLVLSFEESGSTISVDLAHAIIDSVSVHSNAGTYLTNGDFETGLTGWTVSTPTEIQNITSGARTIAGLVVKRSFYTVPNKLWARWVDVFENHTAGVISTNVTYETALGSADYGIIYPTPGTTSKALTSWDSSALTRDIGLVFGNALSTVYTTDDGTGLVGSDVIDVTYHISVPAGGRVAIVNFALMDGAKTGLDPATGSPVLDFSLKATDIDTEAANIVNNFWTDSQYRKGMTQVQIDAISNFAN